MDRKLFSDILTKRIHFLDGAYGTEFFKIGFKGVVETLNILDKEKVYLLQKAYVNAGVDFLLTNTFSANRLKLESLKVKYDVRDINYNAVKIAKKAAKNSNVYILGDISSTGYLLEPLGDISFDDAYSVFKEQGEILLDAGVDGFIIETMTDLKELKAAVLALRDVSKDIPIIAQMTFLKNGKSITGTSVEIFSTLLNDLDVDSIGVNCTLNPKEMLSVFKTLSKFSKKPLSVEPNAGEPKINNNTLNYSIHPREFVIQMENIVNNGANLIGGCCGTTPEHIRLMVEYFKGKKPRQIKVEENEFISSRTRIQKISPFLIIGERINASGKKKLQESIKNRDFSKVVELATSQESKGVHALDVNLGIETYLERAHFKQVINSLDKISSLPISLDIQESEFLEEALKEYVGRPIINSSTAKKKDLDKAIYLLKRYGGILILLTMKNKIPKMGNERYKIAKNAVEYLEKNGISKSRIFIDPIVLPLSTDKNFRETLKAIRLLSKNGYNTIIGLSNISYGLPNREELNSSFISLCVTQGLSAAILNPEEKCTMKSLIGALRLKGIELTNKTIIVNDPLIEIILKNQKKELKKEIDKLLEKYSPIYIIQNILSKAMEKIGELYSKGMIYLPQLILASETIIPIFDYLNSKIKSNELKERGTIVFATVENDVHDIGKKIAITLFKSSGFNIIDLGTNIPSKKIIEAVKKYSPDILALSAMMTTTISKIKEVKKLLDKEEIDIPIIAGGASLNKDIAEKFGIFYAENASEGLKLAIELLKKENNKRG